MIIQHNMAALNMMTQLGVTNDRLKKAAERLSSGYKINRAADNAATLAISEKKRAQIRGLQRAAKNSQDGISFVQTGDGAMSQIGAMLHRMRELTVQALNDGVYEKGDQAALQMEFDQLQSEIDRVNDQTEFNKKAVFEHYATANYSALEGNRVWSQDQIHRIDSSNSSLTVKYVTVADDGTETEKETTLTIPEGTYTTQELMDEMDDVVTALGDAADGLYLEYSDEHMCNMVLQDGKEVKDVSGGLSYLFFDSFGGNKSGALIGTTVFFPGDPLVVKTGENDDLHFRIEYYDGTMKEIDMKVAQDSYTRNDMIKYLNEYRFSDGKTLVDYGMKASEYGEASIQIGGDNGLITGLKGNMFAIDDKHFDSVFYDNTKYGSAKEIPAVFTGGNVLNSADINFTKFNIAAGVNDTLRIRVDGGTYQDIVLDAGNYSISQMVTHLQGKLGNLGIKVSQHSINGVTSLNGNRNLSFSGLTLTTDSVGKESSIEFDVPGSSAYDTLFVDRRYTDYGKSSRVTAGQWRTYNGAPTLTGGREFDSTTDFPLTIDSSNNSFYLEVAEVGKEAKKELITLSEKDYADLNAIKEEINTQIGKTEYKDKIRAEVVSGNKLLLTTKPGNETVTKIDVSGGITDGHEVLFVGEKITYPGGYNINLKPIQTDASGKINFTPSNNKLTVNVGGEIRTVEIPVTGAYAAYTPEELEKLLNESALKGKPTTSNNSYSSYTTSGSTVSVSQTHNAEEKPYTNTGKAGTGGKVDGSTQVKDGESGWHKLGGTLGTYTKVDSSNNNFKISINGKEYSITLDNSDSNGYTQSALVGELQKKLDKETSEANRVKVSVEGGHLKFTTVAVGEGKTVTTDGCSSTFLTSINTNRTKGYTTTSSFGGNTFPFTLTSSTNKFTINIDGTPTTVELDTTKTYNSVSDIQSELNTKLSPKGVNVTRDNYGGLKFERTTPGSGSVRLDINNSGSAGTIMFHSPASATMDSTSVTIPKAADASNPGKATFTVRVGGNTYTAVLENKDTKEQKLTAADLEKVLEGAVWEGGRTPAELGFSLSKSGSYLKFTTTARGSGQSISASATSGPFHSSTPTVKAAVTKNPDGTVSVNLTSSSYFTPKPYNKPAVLQPQGNPPQRSEPTHTTRSYTIAKCKLTTQRPFPMPGSITIGPDNKQLRFTYQYHNGATKLVDISLDEGQYSRETLREELERKINAILEEDPAHAGEGLNVAVSDQITFESKQDGRYNIPTSSLSGGFYERVMMGTALRTDDEKTAYSKGDLVVDDVYIVGRKDVRNQYSTIQKGENDELNVDLTINGKVTPLNMVLDPGTYDSDALVKQVQEKLSEQLEAKGLPRDLVLAGIGVYDSGAAGSNDKNALFFYLNKKAELDPGTYAIDGLSGKALFSIFYKTDGDPIPAYVAGTKDITGGVEIKDGENKFSILVDGKQYEYEIPEGKYDTAEDLVDAVNTAIADKKDDSNLKASLSGNSLKIGYNKLGVHTIADIQGPAKVALFYQVSGRFDQDVDGWLQIGANARQGIDLQRYSVSTLSMGINSLTISGHKYANKALERIDAALDYLSSVRSRYGAMENRLEYAMRVDDIAAENTQYSESIDRDADMAEEMVEYSKSQILQQAGMSILSQVTQNTQSVLSLLQ